MGILACVDTHVLIWGIKKESSSSQVYMIERTVNFLQWMQNERHTVIVPAPVLAEFLLHIPMSEHDKISNKIRSNFLVPSFDAAASSMLAKIWQTNKNNGLPSGTNGRERFKTDAMIIAIAVVNKAKILYSEDIDLQRTAKGFIETKDIPVIPRQMELGE
jgi:predicted nucleic acid-binding protein